MPSWEVHKAVAHVFGLRCSDVDELIDTVMHDVGRRLPREPRLIEKLYDPKALDKYMRKITKVNEIISQVAKDDKKAKCFWLHHILDLLAPRIIALETTGLPAEKFKDNILKALKAEIEFMLNNMKGKIIIMPKLEEASKHMVSQLSPKIIDILEHPVVKKWGSQTAYVRKEYFNKSIRELIKPPHAKRTKRNHISIDTIKIKNYEDGIKVLSWAGKEVITNPRYHYGRLMYRVSYIASVRSHLYDLALLSSLPPAVMGPLFLLPVTKRDYLSLGRRALEHCEEIPWIDDRRKAIIGEVVKFWKNVLKRDGIPLYKGCAETYADTFIEGYEYVKTILERFTI